MDTNLDKASSGLMGLQHADIKHEYIAAQVDSVHGADPKADLYTIRSSMGNNENHFIRIRAARTSNHSSRFHDIHSEFTLTPTTVTPCVLMRISAAVDQHMNHGRGSPSQRELTLKAAAEVFVFSLNKSCRAAVISAVSENEIYAVE
ncbi:hypothetical protein JOB18_002884 [Solea senegalensis]|uniref:Uncharacterized protein n=1 Tax=Solea senegalensis TaxID=28829 RepID=A0AAV6R450_SOLSE|nr:hypothetical protein JOB18_002884 [Solea senegalensis]